MFMGKSHSAEALAHLWANGGFGASDVVLVARNYKHFAATRLFPADSSNEALTRSNSMIVRDSLSNRRRLKHGGTL